MTTTAAPEPERERWVTRAEFQRRFGIGRCLQRKLEREGRLVSQRLGYRTVRLDAESFNRLPAPEVQGRVG